MLTYFYVTGFPKSGNKWLQGLLGEFESVSGFNIDPARGVPLLGSKLLDHGRLQEALRAIGIDFELFVQRLYGAPRNAVEGDARAVPAISTDGRQSLQPMLAELASEASQTARRLLGASIFEHIFDNQARASDVRRPLAAIGVPGMHSPVSQVRSLLPSFRIINLQRDPRDVVVSYFYHYISTLTQPLAEKFIIRDEATDEIAHNPKWKRPFARRVMRSMSEYHGQRMPELREADGVLRVRYEDLLQDGAGELRRMLGFLGCEEPAQAIVAAVEANRFEAITGSSHEQRDNLVRKGVSGDWRNYFDRELLRALGDEFAAIVRDLGYERDDSWMHDVPATVPREFDFARFRIKRSTTRQFAHLWHASPELRQRYPNPWDLDEADSFYAWLCACDVTEVQEWLDLARRLEELWAVDIVER